MCSCKRKTVFFGRVFIGKVYLAKLLSHQSHGRCFRYSKLSMAKKSWHTSFSANFAIEKITKFYSYTGKFFLSKSISPKKICSCKLCINKFWILNHVPTLIVHNTSFFVETTSIKTLELLVLLPLARKFMITVRSNKTR